VKIALDLIKEDTPGPKWRGLYQRFWPAYKRWYYADESGERPPRVVAEQSLRQHMPELMPTYRRLLDLAGGGPQEAGFLTLYGPAPYLSGCSQAVWTRGEPALVRNYDYSPRLWEAVLLATRWGDRRVLAMSDCLWGALDGVNDSGLAVSLAFGGRTVVGDGFGSPLILRYMLETCSDAAAARKVLRRVATHMAYNITVLDADGDHFTAFLAPDREPLITSQAFATNHQEGPGWDRYIEATGSLEREALLAAHLDGADNSLEDLVALFQRPPLLGSQYQRAMGTLYTAVYYPRQGRVELRWPHTTVRRSLDDFEEGEQVVDLAGAEDGESPLSPPRPF
jgi:predicted choloylglycine hydrolase